MEKAHIRIVQIKTKKIKPKDQSFDEVTVKVVENSLNDKNIGLYLENLSFKDLLNSKSKPHTLDFISFKQLKNPSIDYSIKL